MRALGTYPGEAVGVHRKLGRWFRAAFGKESWAHHARQGARHLLAAGEAEEALPLVQKRVLWHREAARYRAGLEELEEVLATGASGHPRGMAMMLKAQLDCLARGPTSEQLDWLREATVLVHEADQGTVHHELADWLTAKGDHSAARAHLERSLVIKRKVAGTEVDMDVAASLVALGRVLQAQGELPAARDHMEQSLDIMRKVLGTDGHPNVTAALRALAGVLKAQGDLSAARTHIERCLEIQRKIFGTDEHPSVADSLDVLAGVLEAQGEIFAASVYLNMSLEIRRKVLDTEDHPTIAATLHELACVLQSQGDLPAARAHLEQSLSIFRKVLGTDEHPKVATSLHSLAGVLYEQGNLDAAEQLYEYVLQVSDRVYGGREHFNSAFTEVSLASVLEARGQMERATSLLRHAHGVFLAKLGPSHQSTQAAATSLSRLQVRNQGSTSGDASSLRPASWQPVLFVLHALAAAGGPLSPELLRALAVRVHLFRDLGPMCHMVEIADIVSERPGDLTRALRVPPPPPDLPAALVDLWESGLSGPLHDFLHEFGLHLDAALQAMPREANGALPAALFHEVDADEEDQRALIAEAQVALLRVWKGIDDWSEFDRHREVWARAAGFAMALDPSVQGAFLAQALLAALPARADSLRAAWRPNAAQQALLNG
jgi:tetratricopeptide (TPR) repeat protein